MKILIFVIIDNIISKGNRLFNSHRKFLNISRQYFCKIKNAPTSVSAQDKHTYF